MKVEKFGLRMVEFWFVVSLLRNLNFSFISEVSNGANLVTTLEYTSRAIRLSRLPSADVQLTEVGNVPRHHADLIRTLRMIILRTAGPPDKTFIIYTPLNASRLSSFTSSLTSGSRSRLLHRTVLYITLEALEFTFLHYLIFQSSIISYLPWEKKQPLRSLFQCLSLLHHPLPWSNSFPSDR